MISAEATPATWLPRCSKGINDDTGARTSHLRRVAAEHCDTRAKFGTAERDHMLANMDSNLLTLVVLGVHQNPLDKVVAVLITSNIDERNTWTIRMGRSDDSEIALEEF